MNKAGLYSTANSLQRRDATYVIDQYNQFLKWSDNDSDLTLDIGCGSGDVTVEVLLKLTNGFVIGTDISTEMVKYAKLAHKYPKLRFQQFDVVTKSIPLHFIGQFDHVVSFYCMHWIQDQRWRNFYNQNFFTILNASASGFFRALSQPHTELFNMILCWLGAILPKQSADLIFWKKKTK